MQSSSLIPLKQNPLEEFSWHEAEVPPSLAAETEKEKEKEDEYEDGDWEVLDEFVRKLTHTHTPRTLIGP